MKLIISCNKFITETAICTHSVAVEMNNDNFYNFTCPAGHEIHGAILNQNFELLFNSASLALLDGYSREAVSGFASALERFYEFYIQTISHHNHIYREVFNKAWKNISKQSERQVGAFLFVYLIENKEEYKGLNEKMANFRNDVIHRGYLPSYEETFKYAEYVLNAINILILELNSKYPDAVRDVSQINSDKAVKKSFESKGTANSNISNFRIATIISTQKTTPHFSYEKSLYILEQVRKHLYST